MKRSIALLGLLLALIPFPAAADHEPGLEDVLMRARCGGPVQPLETIGDQRFYRVTCRGVRPRELLIACTDRGCRVSPAYPQDSDDWPVPGTDNE